MAVLAPHLTLGLMVLLAGAPLLFVATIVPHAAVLPAISLTAIALAAAIGAFAWWRNTKRHTATVTLWDIAGAFMLIGCAAAMMTQPENLMQVFGHTEKP